MATRIARLLPAALVAFAAATCAQAATTVPVRTYSGPNGDGQASGGGYNYWDLSYSGSGSKTTDGAALSGGRGDLTDGVQASAPWYAVENPAGTGPYVGWYAPATANPLFTFTFSGTPVINAIGIHLDNTTAGGVYAPAAILVDGVSRAFTAPPPGSFGVATLSGLNLTGSSHTVQFQQQPGTWTFVSEVTFLTDAVGAVPEPATWLTMIGGFGMVGGAMRRRQRAAKTPLTA